MGEFLLTNGGFALSNFDSSIPVITLRLIEQLKRSGRRFKVADSSGTNLSGRDLLVRTLALRNYLLRAELDPDEQRVGIFLPPTVPAVATNFALALAGRVSVNLNYTVTSKILNQCCSAAGLRRVITSRKFMEKVGLEFDLPVVYLEDVRERIRLDDKVRGFVDGRLRSAAGLHRSLGLSDVQHSDPLTIIFTSGSTAVPKGVVLSGGNITSNVLAIDESIHLSEQDVVLGVLPFFHSFGYTISLWAALTLPCSAVYHYSPLEARPIGQLAEKYGATVLLATPTFLRTYIRRVEPRQFQKMDVVVVGAEKMPLSMAAEFEEKFGARPVEGYGTTELSPLVSVNIPQSRDTSPGKANHREGSVGKPVWGVDARIVSLDDDQPLPSGKPGMLEVRGPNVMQGYLDRPDLTAEVMDGEWYRTGDVARIDEDGFIEITGRLSRFSKIGGEMVPHIQIEETIMDIIGNDDEETLRVAVTSVPDEKRGERLVVLYTSLPMSPGELVQQLCVSGLPKLYVPGEDSFVQVEAIPVLGSGKLDLRGITDLAKQKFHADH